MDKYKICINAGHAPNGIPDPGACYHGLRESDITEEVAKTLTAELALRGYGVTYIQDDDLNKICNVANKAQANLFVSLHCNAYSNEDVGGTEVWLFNRGSNCIKAAEQICENIVNAIGTSYRGLKYSVERKDGNLCVLRDTAMPAMLIEMFFISNREDIKKYKSNTNALVTAIADGVDYYFS